MPLDRNAKYIYQSAKFSLTLLVGTSISGNTYYLNDDAFIGDFIVKGNYKNDLPSGYPLAFMAGVEIFTESFIGEFSELAKWIKDNSSGVNKVPNCWIYETNGNKMYFAQIPSEVEEDDFANKSYKIQLVSTDKWAIERSEFVNIGVSELISAPSLHDMFYSTNDNFGVYTSINIPIETFKMAKLNDIWQSINNEIAHNCNLIHRGSYSYTLYHTVLNSLTLFYPAAIEGDPIGSRIGSQGTDYVYMCYEIRNGDNELVGGYRKWLTTKYKNVWNFITAYAEGLGLRYYRNVSTGGGLDVQYLHQRINRIPIGIEDFESAMKGKYSYNIYSQINNRKNLNYCKFDGGIVFNRIMSLSSSMPSLEYNSLINNVMDSHKSRNGSNGDFYTQYELSEIGNLPFNRLYYTTGYNFFNKVSHACEIRITNNQSDGVVTLQGEGSIEPSLSQYFNVDAFNLYGSAYQLGIPYLANHIIRKVIAEKQTWIELTLESNFANPLTLGMEYDLNIFDKIRENPFYDNNIYTNIGVLVNIETNYSKGETKCKFFLRSDEWAE